MEVIYIKQELLINEQIKVAKVQLIDENGEKKGVLDTYKAREIAQSKNLDLVLVAPNGDIPVCKLMNYGKYKFEQAKKKKKPEKIKKYLK